MRNVTSKEFNRILFAWHKKNYREMPWRMTSNPYRILVSEIMLQQTQVMRVKEKYSEFIKKYREVDKLAMAPLGEVLRLWSGLGYNRRAKYLHQCAKEIVAHHNSKFPNNYDELVKLPGIGRSTAGALLAFVFQKDTPMIDTNIRRILVRVFYEELKRLHLRRSGAPSSRRHIPNMAPSPTTPRLASKGVLAPLDKFMPSDLELYEFASALIPKGKGRMWNYAMLDLGATLCTARSHSEVCPLMKLHGKVPDFVYKKPQKKFAGSERYYRGKLLKLLAKHETVSLQQIQKLLKDYPNSLPLLLITLLKEGMISKEKALYSLPK